MSTEYLETWNHPITRPVRNLVSTPLPLSIVLSFEGSRGTDKSPKRKKNESWVKILRLPEVKQRSEGILTIWISFNKFHGSEGKTRIYSQVSWYLVLVRK